MLCDVRMESSRRRAVAMETGGLPLVSTFALLTIVAGQLQGSGYSEQEPEFLSPLENLTVAQGRDVHFTCTVNHLGTYKVAWIKSDTKTILAIHTHMVTINPRLSVTHNGHNTWKLYIANVEPKDSGTYMCQVNTDPMMSQMGHLSVVIPPDIADDTQSEHIVPEGGTVELHCSAAGVPKPTISWKRTSGRNIVFREDSGKVLKVVESFAGPVLTLKGLQRADMGTYLCIAANSVPPSMSRRYDVSVQFKPVIRVQSPVVLKAADMQVTLQCYVEASPRSLNTWQRGRTQAGGRDKLLNSSKYIVSEESINEYSSQMNLTITHLKKIDFGEYSCVAVNGYGVADGIILLKETPVRTTTTTTTSTTTTTTVRPTTTLPSTTTRPPKRHPKKQTDRGQNSIEADLRQAELNNAFNFYNTLNHNPVNSTNEYAQRTERQKVRPSGPPRHYIYNSARRISTTILPLLITIVKLVV